MTTWLKIIGSARKPISEAPFHGNYSDTCIGFRKANKPNIQKGDRLFLYAAGGSKRIFAEVEATGDPESDRDYNPNIEGSCRWKLPVNYKFNFPIDSGILIDDVICSVRDLRISLRQASHLRLQEEESELMHEKLAEKI